MTKRTKTNASILTLAIFFIIGVASSGSKMNTFSDAELWIPPAYKPDNGVLLIQTHPHKKEVFNKTMVKWLQKNYPYPYEVADLKEIENKEGKYADTKKYQYGILWRYSKPYLYSPGGNSASVYVSDLYGHFVDRSTGNAFPETKKYKYISSGYEPFFNSIVKRFK